MSSALDVRRRAGSEPAFRRGERRSGVDAPVASRPRHTRLNVVGSAVGAPRMGAAQGPSIVSSQPGAIDRRRGTCPQPVSVSGGAYRVVLAELPGR
jgi:hypothetical protein